MLCKTFGELKISKTIFSFNARSICYRNATTFLGGKQDITKMRDSKHIFDIFSFLTHHCNAECSLRISMFAADVAML